MKKYVCLLAMILPLLSSAQLVMTNNYFMVLSGGTQSSPTKVVLNDSFPSGMSNRGSGWIISEGEFNMVQWNIGTQTGTYRVRFGYATSDSLPVTCVIKSSGVGSGDILFSTYHCPSFTNVPYPSDVNNMSDFNFGNYSNRSVDRFWIVDAKNYSTKPSLDSIRFTYLSSGASSEIAGSNIILPDSLLAQRFNSSLNKWDWIGEKKTNILSLSNTGTVSSGVVLPSDFYRSWSLFKDTNITTIIPLVKNPSSINIFPNPNTGSFSVTGLLHGQVVELYNYIGQKLNSIISDNCTMFFDISTKTNGVYLIRILSTDGILLMEKRIVKTL